MPGEEWRDVVGYEGLYMVSSLGRVKSLGRKYINSLGRNRSVKEKILKQTINARGYLKLNFSILNKNKTKETHKVIAESFLNHVPCGFKEVVDHINNDKLDNRVENLQLTTNRYNSSKDKKGGTSKYIGVSWINRDKKWMASIRINGGQKNLGYYKCELEAAKAYQEALAEHLKNESNR